MSANTHRLLRILRPLHGVQQPSPRAWESDAEALGTTSAGVLALIASVPQQPAPRADLRRPPPQPAAPRSTEVWGYDAYDKRNASAGAAEEVDEVAPRGMDLDGGMNLDSVSEGSEGEGHHEKKRRRDGDRGAKRTNGRGGVKDTDWSLEDLMNLSLEKAEKVVERLFNFTYGVRIDKYNKLKEVYEMWRDKLSLTPEDDHEEFWISTAIRFEHHFPEVRFVFQSEVLEHLWAELRAGMESQPLNAFEALQQHSARIILRDESRRANGARREAMTVDDDSARLFRRLFPQSALAFAGNNAKPGSAEQLEETRLRIERFWEMLDFGSMNEKFEANGRLLKNALAIKRRRSEGWRPRDDMDYLWSDAADRYAKLFPDQVEYFRNISKYHD